MLPSLDYLTEAVLMNTANVWLCHRFSEKLRGV